MKPAYCILFIALLCLAAGGRVEAQSQRVEVVGDDLGGGLRAAIESVLPMEDAPETVFEARRQARRAAALAIEALNAEGRFAASVETGVEPGPPPRALIRVSPGPLFSISSATIEFADPPPMRADADIVRSVVSFPDAAAASPGTIVDVQERIRQQLRDLGYPNARIVSRDILGDRDAASVEIVYRVESGRRVRFGDLVTPQDTATRDPYYRRLSPIQTGEVYDPDAISKYSARLTETRIFDSAAVRLADTPSGIAEDGSEIRDVILLVDERKRNTIAVGGSFATNEGPGAEIEYQRRNLIGRGDTGIALATIAQLEQSLGFAWRLPNQPSLRRSLIFDALVGREDTDAFDRNAFEFGAALEARIGSRTTLSFGGRYELSDETSVAAEDGSTESRTFQVVSASGAASIDRSNDPLDPSSGWRAQIVTEPSVSFGEDPSQFVRTTARASAYVPFFAERLIAAGRVSAGSVIGASSLDLPVDDRFFAGGGGSVRGFGFQDVGPRDVDGQPIGGRGLFETSAELRWWATDTLGAVAFVDGGSVVSNNTPSFDNLLYGAGFGIRYATPAGPIRLDVAFPINGTSFDDDFQIYISIGQAF